MSLISWLEEIPREANRIAKLKRDGPRLSNSPSKNSRNRSDVKTLAAKGIEIVKSNLNGKAALIKAMEGSSAINAVTYFFVPVGKGVETEKSRCDRIHRGSSPRQHCTQELHT